MKKKVKNNRKREYRDLKTKYKTKQDDIQSDRKGLANHMNKGE